MRDYIGTDEHGVKQYKTLRLTIVSSNSSFKFQLMTTYQFIHTTGEHATYTPDQVSELGGAAEKSRSQFRKLAINSGQVLNFNVAVVIELVDESTVGKKSEIGVGYEYQNMANWEPTADTRGIKIDEGETVKRRGNASIDLHLVPSVARIESMAAEGTLYTDDIKYFFEDLADAYYAVTMINDDIPAKYNAQVNAVIQYKELYSAYRTAIKNGQKTQKSLVDMLMGLK